MCAPLLRVAAREAIRDTGRAGHRTAPFWRPRYLSTFCLSGAKSRSFSALGTRLGGLEQVEEEFGRHLARERAVEPLVEELVRFLATIAAAGEDRERALLLDERHRLIVQKRREFLQHDGRFEPRLHRCGRRRGAWDDRSQRECGQLLDGRVAERIDRVERFNAEAHGLLGILDERGHRGAEFLDAELRGHLRGLAANDVRAREDAHADRP